MAETRYKVGDMVLSIYPPDYPHDNSYYDAKIVGVSGGVRVLTACFPSFRPIVLCPS